MFILSPPWGKGRGRGAAFVLAAVVQNAPMIDIKRCHLPLTIIPIAAMRSYFFGVAAKGVGASAAIVLTARLHAAKDANGSAASRLHGP
ncbi:MAG: hypothetical protein WCD46_03120 [Desulfobacterales bacterium]